MSGAPRRHTDGADFPGRSASAPEGRETRRALTPAEVAALVLVAGGLDADPAAALVDLARAGDEPGFRTLAGAVGVPCAAITPLWDGARRRLGVPVTALLE